MVPAPRETPGTPPERHRHATSNPRAGARPLERAQLVWHRACELGGRREPGSRFDLALELLSIARNDPATIAHARTLGRTHLRAHADDAGARAGAGILDAAIAFLGTKPHPYDRADH